MANITIATLKNGKATITQNAWMHFCTLDALTKEVNAVNGKIAKTTDGFFKATVDCEKTAKTIVRTVERSLAKARKNKATDTDNKATLRTQNNAPTVGKGKANLVTVTDEKGNKYTIDKANLVPTTAPNAKAHTPKKAKGNGFDFGKIKGKDNSAKNRALHATLVKMGLKDSRSTEYLAVWNARPWAK